MYRDDTCAVCGESLPPDHSYCRQHGAEVDDRLHTLGAVLARLVEDLPRAARLLGEIADDTWGWLAEEAERQEAVEDAVWPASPPVALRVHADEVDIDVDSEPGRVRLRLETPLAPLLAAVGQGLRDAGVGTMASVCAQAEGGNTTR